MPLSKLGIWRCISAERPMFLKILIADGGRKVESLAAQGE